jgi:hypothetical protein
MMKVNNTAIFGGLLFILAMVYAKSASAAGLSAAEESALNRMKGQLPEGCWTNHGGDVVYCDDSSQGGLELLSVQCASPSGAVPLYLCMLDTTFVYQYLRSHKLECTAPSVWADNQSSLHIVECKRDAPGSLRGYTTASYAYLVGIAHEHAVFVDFKQITDERLRPQVIAAARSGPYGYHNN